VNILLLSTGGGGGNILRSLKTLFRRDLLVAQKTDPRYADRLRRSVVTRFLDTNEFSLADVPKEERVLIGARTTRLMGSMHNPEVARAALEESQADVEQLLSKYSVVIVIGTGGKGTGAGTIFPLAQMARQQGKLVIPIFVRPSFERHEVEKARYDHALRVVQRFDAAGIRFVEILNDCGYVDADPQPQTAVWERMNLPIARGLRGWLYVLSDLSQVDPSDLSMLFAGGGRLRMGFSEINPSPGSEPGDDVIEGAALTCWDNPYYAFSGPVGTTLVCIQGEWSNVVDAKIKGRLAAYAAAHSNGLAYNPLYARAPHAPRPWGVTAIFAEYTGKHEPLAIDWTSERAAFEVAGRRSTVREPEATIEIEEEVVALPQIAESSSEVSPKSPREADQSPTESNGHSGPRAFSRLWDFAFAVHRSDPDALAVAAADDTTGVPIDAEELRRLLITMWFPSVFARLSRAWKDRLLDVLVEGVVVPDHVLRVGRETVRSSQLDCDRLREILKKTLFPDAIRADLQLLDAVGSMWGRAALERFTFAGVTPSPRSSKLALILQPFRHT
jgi:cell division GTPase FtsZ